MGIFQKLFGQPKAAQAQTPQEPFSTQLQKALLPEIPSTWTVHRVKQIRVEIPYPSSWAIGVSDEWIMIRPVRGTFVRESGQIYFNPGFTFRALSAANSDDALLDELKANWERGVQGCQLREATKFTLNGTRTLSVRYDRARSTGTWSTLLTIRAFGDIYWEFSAEGLSSDMALFHSDLVPVLANLRHYLSDLDFTAAQSKTFAPPIHDTMPEGNAVGVLFEIEKCEDVQYGHVFETELFRRLDMRRLVGTEIRIGDIFPECRFYCIRADGPDDVIQYIRSAIGKISDYDALPSAPYRFMSGTNLLRAPLVRKGQVQPNGKVI